MTPGHRLRTEWLLLAAAGFLIAVDAVARLTFVGRSHVDHAPLRWFNSSVEASLPTYFTVLVTFALGRCCWRTRCGPRWPWRVLGSLFVWLAVDDLLGLHERIGAMVAPHLPGDGVVYAWVIVLGPVFAAIALVATVAIVRSPVTPRATRQLLLAGFGLLAVAVAIEAGENVVLGSGLRLRGIPLLTYSQVAEEALEVLAPVVLLAACRTPPAVRSAAVSRAAAGAASPTASVVRG